MKTTIAQNEELLKALEELLRAHRGIFKQERVYQRITALVYGKLATFGRHTLSQMILVLGLVHDDWTAWYRVFNQARFSEERAREVLFGELLKHIEADGLLVVGGDGMQTPRTGKHIEGVGYLRNYRTPAFKVGIHLAQRWFHGAVFLPEDNGFTRAVTLWMMAAFTEKAQRTVTVARQEWQAAHAYLDWISAALQQAGRMAQSVLFVADGSYDCLDFWRGLQGEVTALIRTAKNRALFALPPQDGHGNRKYGPQLPAPEQLWRETAKRHWTWLTVTIRGRVRRLRYRLVGPVLRKPLADRPLFLIVVGGEHYRRHGHKKQREPLAYLVSAKQDAQGQWRLPLPIATLLLWAWQRWELEVTHRELKSQFGLGQMQGWTPAAALTSVAFSAWVYSLCVLAGYRTWGLTPGPTPPSPWWRGAGRWSFNTLWRALRAAIWGEHHFQASWSTILDNWSENRPFLPLLRDAAFASVRL